MMFSNGYGGTWKTPQHMLWMLGGGIAEKTAGWGRACCGTSSATPSAPSPSIPLGWRGTTAPSSNSPRPSTTNGLSTACRSWPTPLKTPDATTPTFSPTAAGRGRTSGVAGSWMPCSKRPDRRGLAVGRGQESPPGLPTRHERRQRRFRPLYAPPVPSDRRIGLADAATPFGGLIQSGSRRSRMGIHFPPSPCFGGERRVRLSGRDPIHVRGRKKTGNSPSASDYAISRVGDITPGVLAKRTASGTEGFDGFANRIPWAAVRSGTDPAAAATANIMTRAARRGKRLEGRAVREAGARPNNRRRPARWP